MGASRNAAGVGGYSVVVGLLAVTSFWYGGTTFAHAFGWARYGVLNVPALVIGAVELWGGGLFALVAGSLDREPPSMPGQVEMIGWTVVVFVAVLALVLMRRPEVEERLPHDTRRALGGRFVLLGAVVTAALLLAVGYF